MPQPHEIETSPLYGLAASVDPRVARRKKQSLISAAQAAKARQPAPKTNGVVGTQTSASYDEMSRAVVVDTPIGPRPLWGPQPVPGARLPTVQTSQRIADNAVRAIANAGKNLKTILGLARSADARSKQLAKTDPRAAAALKVDALKRLEQAKIIARGILKDKGTFVRAASRAGAATAAARNPGQAKKIAELSRRLNQTVAKIEIPRTMRPGEVATRQTATGMINRNWMKPNPASFVTNDGFMNGLGNNPDFNPATLGVVAESAFKTMRSVSAPYRSLPGLPGLPPPVYFGDGDIATDVNFLKVTTPTQWMAQPSASYTTVQEGSSLLERGLGNLSVEKDARQIELAVREGASEIGPELLTVLRSEGKGLGSFGLGNVALGISLPSAETTAKYTDAFTTFAEQAKKVQTALKTPKTPKSNGSAATGTGGGLSTTTKVAIGVGGAAVLGGVLYLALRR